MRHNTWSDGIPGYGYDNRAWVVAAEKAAVAALALIAPEARRSRLRKLANAIRHARGFASEDSRRFLRAYSPEDQEQLDAIEALNPDFTALEWGHLHPGQEWRSPLTTLVMGPRPHKLLPKHM